MKALVKTGKNVGYAYKEIPKPVPGPGEILVKVKAAAVCGSDIHSYLWDENAENFAAGSGVSFPYVVGHEYAGIVEELGEGVTEFSAGDRVSMETHIFCGKCYHCQNGMAHNCTELGGYGAGYGGCFAEYCVAPTRVVYKLPDGVSFEEGAIFEPSGVAMHAVDEAQVSPGDTIVVYGAGPVGLVAIQILNVCGAGRVIAVDMNEYRLKMAEEFGAVTLNPADTDVVEEVRRLTAIRGGADAVLEMTGSPRVYQNMFEMLRKEGRIVTVGHPGTDVPVNVTRYINQKGISWKGIYGRKVWKTWTQLASLVDTKKINLPAIITHRFALEQCEEAFEQMKNGAGKVLFIPEMTETKPEK